MRPISLNFRSLQEKAEHCFGTRTQIPHPILTIFQAILRLLAQALLILQTRCGGGLAVGATKVADRGPGLDSGLGRTALEAESTKRCWEG